MSSSVQTGPAPEARPDETDDVAIVGGGFAGSVLALVLARQGRRVSLIDLHGAYPPDFRCEKLSRRQLALLNQLGLAGAFAELNLAHEGVRYEALVAAARAAWPAQVRFLQGRARQVHTGEGDQTVRLASGEVVRARLAVIATGPGESLRAGLGITRQMLRERHSIAAGVSLRPRPGQPAVLRSVTVDGAQAGDRIGYASFFPMNGALRVNLFSYQSPKDPWTQRLRRDPIGALRRALPGAAPLLAGMRVEGPVELRCTDLYASDGYIQPGVVLIGDAFATCCPATGEGLTRILLEVRQLANAYLPGWLATPGMSATKIAQFYADPVKRGHERKAAAAAERARSKAVETSLAWRIARGATGLKRRSRSVTHRLSAVWGLAKP
jgi:2-polyprenyl-6-methoxyphenol hydroxylase-like FAD-dependent oxidoreductase